MNALTKSLRVKLSISQVMPHIRLPIGIKSEGSLFAMIDTGAGLNLGRLSYHKGIFESHPHLVATFAYIKDVENLSEFDIGGVDAEGNMTRVTAVIVYKTPFKVNAMPVNVAFGLSPSASTNTIIGLPFIRATRCSFFFDGTSDERVLSQTLGFNFPLTYQVPLRADKPPQTGDINTRASYQASSTATDNAPTTSPSATAVVHQSTPTFANAYLVPPSLCDTYELDDYEFLPVTQE